MKKSGKFRGSFGSQCLTTIVCAAKGLRFKFQVARFAYSSPFKNAGGEEGVTPDILTVAGNSSRTGRRTGLPFHRRFNSSPTESRRGHSLTDRKALS
jgi:hypothetical protein